MARDFLQLPGKAGYFPHGKKTYLLAILSFVHGVAGDEATSSSFSAENEATDASSSSLEAFIATL